jgi:transcriptional regulator of acetoin/glycerol metabolism
MAHSSGLDTIPPDAKDVAVNRVRFLTAEPAEPSRVRPSILASWRRSRDLSVSADKIELPYQRDPDIDTPLTRSAEPILRHLHEQLNGHAVSIILTDPAGLVLSRRTTDAELERHLDHVLLAPGFSYAEEFVGTNGIGTALEAGSGTQVFGHEHYAENLETLACAGVPIHDPISGRTVGAVDLTCWRKDAESLLLTLAETTAEQICKAMLTDSGVREFEVLQAYRRTCRRTTGIVFALTNDAVMLNDHARSELDPADQAALLSHAGEAVSRLGTGRRQSVGVILPTGASARMYCQQVSVGTEPAGLVVHVKVGETEARVSGHRSSALHMPLPGLIGDSPLWRRVCTQIEGVFTSGDWLAVDGEPGVGKLAILRAVQLRRQPARRFVVLDAAEASSDRHWMTECRRQLTDDPDTVIIQHVDMLDAKGMRALTSALQEVKRDPAHARLWIAVTLLSGGGRTDLDQLLRLFPTTVEVPPLRLRLEDLPPLVSFFLAKLGHGSQVTCSPEAMRLLLRSSWPGNVDQLHHVLQQIGLHRRSGPIDAEDLPAETLSMSRRVLTRLESMERDAIVRGLTDSGGNKVAAARSLGMSRATIYRKIHEYGIVTPG